VSQTIHPPSGKRAVVAVICQKDCFLAIRRSDLVAAPGKICFPGGGIQTGESEEVALEREIMEELGVPAVIGQRLFHSYTYWGTSVAWWTARIAEGAELNIDLKEVAQWWWMPPKTMCEHPDLLSSNRDFLVAWKRKEFTIPEIVLPADLHGIDY